MQVLLLEAGGERCAVALVAVREVVRDPAVAPLPTAPPALLGLFGLRGELVPALDTGALLGLAPVAGRAWCAVVDLPSGPCGLVVDAPPVQRSLGARLTEASGPGRLGAHEVDGRAATLLEPQALVAQLGGVP